MEKRIYPLGHWADVLGSTTAKHTALEWINQSKATEPFAASLDSYMIRNGGLTVRQLHAAYDIARGHRMPPKSKGSTTDNKANNTTDKGDKDRMTIEQQNATVTRITNTQRTVVRAAITKSGGWDDYRRKHGINSSALSSTADFVACANACAVSIPAVLKAHNQNSRDKVEAAKTEKTTDAESGNAAFEATGGKTKTPVVEFDENRVRQIAREEAQSVFDPDPIEKIIIDKGHTKIEVKDTLTHPQFANLLAATVARDFEGNRLGAMLVGPAATGKSYSCRQAARALGLGFAFQGKALESYDLIGFVDANGVYHETQFVKAFRDGLFFLADEADDWEPSALTAINGALANGELPLPTGETITRHTDFVCVMGTNTWGYGADAEYSSRQKLDGSTLSRFPVKLNWHVCEELEQAITMAKCDNDDRAIRWTTEIQIVRHIMDDMQLPKIADARAIQAGAALLMSGMELQAVRDLTYLGPLDKDQRRAVADKLTIKLGN